jgi:hypothetical protein
MPAILANAGTKFIEFFAARIRNANTCETCAELRGILAKGP